MAPPALVDLARLRSLNWPGTPAEASCPRGVAGDEQVIEALAARDSMAMPKNPGRGCARPVYCVYAFRSFVVVAASAAITHSRTGCTAARERSRPLVLGRFRPTYREQLNVVTPKTVVVVQFRSTGAEL